MADLGRLLVVLGIALVVIGGIVMLLGRTGLPWAACLGTLCIAGKILRFTSRWPLPS